LFLLIYYGFGNIIPSQSGTELIKGSHTKLIGQHVCGNAQTKAEFIGHSKAQSFSDGPFTVIN